MKFSNTMKPLAIAVLGLGLSAPVLAFSDIDLGQGTVLESRLTATYSVGTRLSKADRLLSSDATNATGNDGNNNFKRGDLTANRLALLFDTHLKSGRSGFVLSASTFYDDVYHQSNSHSKTVNAPNTLGKADQFPSRTKRYHGGYSRLMDAYAYTTFNLGEQGRMTVRAGKHVVSWGETLFIGGVSSAQGPADGTKVGVAGTEVKDMLLPEDQVSLLYEVTPELSLMAHAQYGWHETILNAPGSFMSNNDLMGPGSPCLSTAGGRCTGPRVKGKEPKDTGQWGVGAKYRVTDETEVGLIYLNYHDRAPAGLDVRGMMMDIGGTPTFIPTSYSPVFFDNIKMLATTFTTTFGEFTVGGEVSYRKDAPANLVGGAPTKANVWQTNVNTMYNLGRTVLAPQGTFLAEIAHTDISSHDAINGNKKLLMGSYGTAFSTTLSLVYPGIIENWELSVPVSYSRQLKGRTVQGNLGMGEGDHRLSVGATMTYRRNLQIGLTYMGYLGKASLDPVKNRALTDRDQLTAMVKYTF